MTIKTLSNFSLVMALKIQTTPFNKDYFRKEAKRERGEKRRP